MDKTDEKILDMLMEHGRMSFQEIGDALGMSRVAAKKRVARLEREGVIRGYRACVQRDGEIMMLIDAVTKPERYGEVISFITEELPYVRQVYRTTKENHVHVVAVSDSVSNLKRLVTMFRGACGDAITQLQCHAVREVVKDEDRWIEPYEE